MTAAPTSIPRRERKLGLIFPGQGSQHAGMGRRVADLSEAARRVFDEADEILGFNMSRAVLEGSDQDLSRTTTTQPAILAVSWAYLAYLRERAAELGRNVRPELVSGHSFGQFTAAAAAESIGFADALKLVRERGRIMERWAKRRPGGMASVIGPTDSEVRDVCDEVSPAGDVGVAAVNAPGQTVISGTLASLSRAIDLIRERGARVVQLPISVPGHFPKMAGAREELRKLIDTIEFQEPKAPVVSSLTGSVLTSGAEVRQELSDQMTGAINWMRAFLAMRRAGVSTFFELGPGHVLANISRRVDRDAEIVDIFDESQWADLVIEPDAAGAVNPAAAAP